ncbi:serine hydrolase domain-containing protein (plasmid) [Bernardetia sp. Wsw4-3y2]|uniref:serine hydrolase domain-containing protein n=1 Tax=Bernardetia sp. Wsw4-3y2 TaxID=3127471 RepID=UPI0030D00EEB
MLKYIYILLIAPLIFTGCVKSNQPTQVKDNTNLSKIVDSGAKEMLTQPLINSASIAIFYKEKEYIGHYGELEKGKNNKPSNSTIYEIGSLSKVLTGTLVANAVLEEKIDIEDNITKYLDGEYPNLSYSNQPIKVKNLLTHTSRLPNMLPLELNPILDNFLDYDTPLKINEVLKEYNKTKFLKDLHTIKIDAQLGKKYSYSSAGTELTAHILEQIYKTDYENILTNFLSKEIGMTNTKVNLNEEDSKELAVGYHVDNPKATLPMGKLPWGAGGGIKSTIPDMMSFIKYQLKNNMVVEESHKTLYKADSTTEIAYFWRADLADTKLGKYYFHHGGVPRSQCYIFIIPKHNLGAFIITNQSGTQTAKIMATTLDKIFEELLEIKN